MISSLCESCVKKEIASKSLMLKENKSSSEVCFFFFMGQATNCTTELKSVFNSQMLEERAKNFVLL